MRPVNLIPPSQRRGESAPLRTGPLVYILIGALVLVLAGVTGLVLTGNEIAERKDEVAQLKREDAAAQARAQRLAAYAQFRSLSEQRAQTIASLADSRFDWERVMRELALILPSDVWLVSLNATATSSTTLGGEASESGSSASGLRGSIAGPALELSGCAKGHDGVAGFITALKDIDGVTRVGVETSELASGSGGAGSGGGEDCRTRDFIASFNLVVGFDAAPAPITAETEAAPVSATEEAQSASSETTEGSEESSGEG